MTITLNGTTGITTDTGYSGDGVTFADGTPSNTLVTNTSGNVGVGTSSPALGFVVEKDNGSGYVAGFRSAPGSPILTIQNTGGISQIQGLNSALSATANIALQVSGGNVGIGTSSPSYKLDIVGSAARISNAGTANFATRNSTAGVNWEWGVDGSGNGFVYTGQSSSLVFSNSATERMRIDSSGKVLIRLTGGIAGDTAPLQVDGGSVTACALKGGTNNYFMAFYGAYSNALIGSITGSTGSSTAYNTSSDYRLKENIAPMTGALATVAQLKPVTYTWKSTGEESQGFIAHELQAVVPDCVTGEKDAVELVDIKDEEGNVIGQEERPVYQGIDTSFLVATLTAAIQEQQAIITEQSLALQDLKARIETLENK